MQETYACQRFIAFSSPYFFSRVHPFNYLTSRVQGNLNFAVLFHKTEIVMTGLQNKFCRKWQSNKMCSVSFVMHIASHLCKKLASEMCPLPIAGANKQDSGYIEQNNTHGCTLSQTKQLNMSIFLCLALQHKTMQSAIKESQNFKYFATPAKSFEGP